MSLSRRGFLTGIGVLVAAPAIVRASSLMPIKAAPLVVYGRSPAMVALPDWEFLEGMTQRLVATIVYGNPDWSPMQFGLTPNYPGNI